MRTALCSLLFAALCATNAAALAQSLPSSIDRAIDDEHRRGMSLRAQHQDDAARAIFESLWTRTHEPRARARQALAEQSLGRHADAEAHLVEALAFAEDPWIAQNRTLLEPVLQQARAAQGIAILTVRCETAPADVVIGGSEVGSVGSTLRVPPGRVTFEVRAEGFASVSRSVDLAPGAVIRVDVALERAATNAQTPVPSTSATPPVARAVSPAVIVRQPRAERRRDARETVRALAWTAAATTVVTSGAASVAVIVGGSAAARWNSEACLPSTLTREQSCPDEIATAETMRALSIAGFAAAGAFTAASVALFVASRPSEPSRERARVVCAPSVGGASMSFSCAGAF